MDAKLMAAILREHSEHWAMCQGGRSHHRCPLVTAAVETRIHACLMQQHVRQRTRWTR